MVGQVRKITKARDRKDLALSNFILPWLNSYIIPRAYDIISVGVGREGMGRIGNWNW